MKTSIIIGIVVLMALLSMPVIYAQEAPAGNAEQDDTEQGEAGETEWDDDDVYIMEDMVIKEKVQLPEVGKTEIPREFIQNMPKGNSGVTDLLQMVPGVQFDENSRNAESGGEIAPADISISGGKSYENLFLIDGMNNSSSIDPGSKSPYQANDVPGNAQRFFIDSWIIEDITVYDSNIPAAYDGFTGGVVDVVTKRPKSEVNGHLSYRTTRSDWVEYHMTDRQKKEYEMGNKYGSTPAFDKHFISAALSVPATADLSFIGSYSYNFSTIPQSYFNTWRNTERVSQTAYLKSIYNIDGSSFVDLSLSYSPHNSTYIIEDTLNSEFNIIGGGYFAGANYNRDTASGGNMRIHGDFSHSENKRNAPDTYKSWITSIYKPWGALLGVDPNTDNLTNSNEGGMGSINKYETGMTLKYDHTLGVLDFLGEHTITYGAAVTSEEGRYNRMRDAISYTSAVASKSVDCDGNNENCVDGDQYFNRRTVTPASDVTARVNTYAGYVEDSWDFSRFNLRTGLRVTNDDYMNNTNLAPRLQGQYYIFDNDRTVLTAGYSRYYSASLLTNKLREGQLPSYEEYRSKYQNKVQDWEISVDGVKVTYNFRELRTPYSDEYMVGVDQKIFDSVIGVKYVERRNGDEFASERTVGADGYTYYILNNNGSSTYRSVQLRWSKSWKNHSLIINGTWQESKTSNDNYNDVYGLEELEDRVVFEGKLVRRHELPRDNFNRPWVVNVAYTGRFFEHLAFTAMIKYRSAYEQLELVDSAYIIGTGDVDPVTGDTTNITTQAYEIRENDDSITVDCSVSWAQRLWRGHTLVASLEVYNLFNAKNMTSSRTSVSSYEMGRQFLAGVRYEF